MVDLDLTVLSCRRPARYRVDHPRDDIWIPLCDECAPRLDRSHRPLTDHDRAEWWALAVDELCREVAPHAHALGLADTLDRYSPFDWREPEPDREATT